MDYIDIRSWIWFLEWHAYGGGDRGVRVAGWSVHHSMRICVVEVSACFCSACPLITLHCMSLIVTVTFCFYYVRCPKMSSSLIWKFRKESVWNEAIKSWLWSKSVFSYSHANEWFGFNLYEEKKRNSTTGKFCWFILMLKFMHLFVAQFVIFMAKTKKKLKQALN